MDHPPTRYLLNIGHAVDHMFMLIFATAVTHIAREFGVQRWEDLLPYSVAAFFLFGLGSIPAGRLGDHWGRRPMMVVFFVGLGVSAMLVGLANSPLQIAMALGLLGLFASIYHPVGIPMLVQGVQRPGWVIGVNGLAGNLGVAGAALVTGFLVKYAGWRMAFVIPGVLSIVCGIVFARVARAEGAAPAKGRPQGASTSRGALGVLLLVLTLASTSGNFVFNFSTSSNYELLADRFRQISQDPAQLGILLALIYAVASLAQLVVGRLIDRYPIRTLYMSVVAVQGVLIALSTVFDGWAFYLMQFLFMAAIFGSVPFTDAVIVRYVDDSVRSRVAGMRLAVSLGASSLAVWSIGPVVKQAGFTTLLWVMACTSLVTLGVVSLLPRQQPAS